MAHATVGADLGQALDVRRHVAPQVTFDEDLLRRAHPIDDLAQASHLFLAEVLGPRFSADVGGFHDLLRSGPADPVDVHQGNDHALLRGYVDTGESRHLAPHPCRCLCFGVFEQITRTTPFRLITLQLGHIFLTDGRTFISKSLESALAIDRGWRARPPLCLRRGAGVSGCRHDRPRERGSWPRSRAQPGRRRWEEAPPRPPSRVGGAGARTVIVPNSGRTQWEAPLAWPLDPLDCPTPPLRGGAPRVAGSPGEPGAVRIRGPWSVIATVCSK